MNHRNYKAKFSDVFGDPASRYAEGATSPLADFSKIVAPSHTSRRDAPSREEIISGRIAKMAAEGDGNIVGYASNYGAKVNNIKNLIQIDPRNYVAAEQGYRDLCDVASDNPEALTSMRRFGALRGDPLAATVAENALALETGAFNNEEVVVDGEKTTLGRLFGGEGYRANRSRRLADLGFSPRVADDYFGDDRDKSDAVAAFVRSGIEAYSKDHQSLSPIHLQLSEAADYVSDNYDEMKATLGAQGARALVNGVLKKYGDAGGMTEVMRGVLKHARKFAGVDADGNPTMMEDGHAYVNNILRGLDAIGTAVYRNPDTGEYKEMTPSEKRFVTMAGLSALDSVSSIDPSVRDFRKPEVTAAVLSAADVFNRARACGYDLFTNAKLANRPITEDFAAYFKAYATGSPPPPDSVVTMEMDADRFLGSCITAGPSVQRPGKATGNRGYYQESPAHFNGVEYPSEGMGWMQKRIVGAIKSATLARRLGGASVRSAVEDMATGADAGKFQAAITGAISRGFDSGVAGDTLAAVLYEGIVGRIVSGEAADPYDISKEIGAIALQGAKHPAMAKAVAEGYITEADAAKAVNAAKSWHLSNVSAPNVFAKERARIAATLSSEFGGYDKETAATLADVYVQQAHLLMMSGKPQNAQAAQRLLDLAQNVGFTYAPRVRRGADGQPVMDKKGNPLYDELQYEDGTSEPILELVPGDIRNIDIITHRRNQASYVRQQRILSQKKPME